MKRALLAAFALVLMAGAVQAQNAPLSGLAPRGTPQSTDLIPVLPAGAPRLESMTVGDLAGMLNAGLGTGSVTTVTCGSGLSGGTFTVSGTCALEANGVTLGDLATAGANTVLGNFSAGAANVAAEAMPSCADTGGNHLNYVSGTGVSCGTSLPTSGVTAGTYSTPTSVSVNAAGQVTAITGSACASNCGIPLLSSFAWVDQGTATASQATTGQAIQMLIPDCNCASRRILAVNVPSTPWKVIELVRGSSPNSKSTAGTSVFLYDGTKVISFDSLVTSSGFETQVARMPNATTNGTTPFVGATGWGMTNSFTQFLYLQIRDDGTTLYFDTSLDGTNFYNQYSEAVGSYMTPTMVGWGGLLAENQSTPMAVSLQAWTLYPDANLSGP